MCSEEGKDGSKRANVVRGRLGFLGGEVDVALIIGYQNVIVSATGFHGQLTGEVRSRRLNRTVIQERRRGWGKQIGSGFS